MQGKLIEILFSRTGKLCGAVIQTCKKTTATVIYYNFSFRLLLLTFCYRSCISHVDPPAKFQIVLLDKVIISVLADLREKTYCVLCVVLKLSCLL